MVIAPVNLMMNYMIDVIINIIVVVQFQLHRDNV